VDPQTIANNEPIERQINVANADAVADADNVLQAERVETAAEVRHADEVHLITRSGIVPTAPYRLSHPLVGREDQLAEIKARLDRREDVALHGLPGVGKTALAITLANDPDVLARFPEGVLWAGLGMHPDVPALLGRWARELEMTPLEISRCAQPEDLSRAIAERISLRRLLLVIDDAWDDRAMLFRAGGPNCAHILTTRSPLLAVDFDEDGETDIRELDEHDALALLADLAPEAVKEAPKEAIELVRAVGSLPLALNLLGYGLKRAQFEGRIPEALELFRTAEDRLLQDMPQRPRERHPDLPHTTSVSLLAVIGISEEALDQTARHALSSLSVFPPKTNTFSEEAAVAVSSDPPDSITRLAVGWLVERIGGRYALHQTIADYARAQLSDLAPFERMAEFFLGHLEQHEADYLSERSVEWLAWLETESDNLRAILRWAKGARPDIALRLGAALWRFWEIRGLYGEGRRELNELAELTGAKERTATRAKVVSAAGNLAYRQGDVAAARPHFEESLSILRELGDQVGTADALSDLGNTLNASGRYDEALPLYEESLRIHERLGNRRGMAVALNNIGFTAYRQGDYAIAVERLERALAMFRELGDVWDCGFPLSGLALVALWQGNPSLAAERWTECRALRTQVGDRRGEAEAIGGLGLVAYWNDDLDEAMARHQESLRLREELDDRRGLGFSLTNIGNVTRRAGDLDTARSHLERALALRRELDDRRGTADSLTGLGRVEIARGAWAAATELLEESLRLRVEMGDREGIAESAERLASIRIATGEDAAGVTLLAAARGLREEIGAPRWPADARDLDDRLVAARSRLGDQAISGASAAGMGLSIGEIASLALSTSTASA
jgi:tetratricopeptide (TPR) repeat protein